MEVIETCDNLEFEVIYDDGTRRRVPEGVLWEVTADGEMIFHKGTSRPEVIIAAAEDVLKYLKLIGPGLKVLAADMWLSADAAAALRELVSYALQEMVRKTVDLPAGSERYADQHRGHAARRGAPDLRHRPFDADDRCGYGHGAGGGSL